MNAAQEQKAVALQTVRGVMGQYKGELVASLPSHLKEQGIGFMTSALANLRRNDTLLRYAHQDPASLITALSEAAQLGLMPGTSEYWLTPKAGKILGIVGWEGEIELMYRAGAVSSVIAEKVHEHDVFKWHPSTMTRPVHEVDWFGADRGKCIGAYAYAVMRDGAISKVVVADRARIERAKKASASAKSEKEGPWETDEPAMILKTAVHDLAKFVPTSAEYRNQMVKAEREAAPAPTPEAAAPAPTPQQAEQPPAPAAPQPAAEQPLEDLGEQYDNEPNYPDHWGQEAGA